MPEREIEDALYREVYALNGARADALLERAGVPWVPGLALSRKVRLRDLLRDARTLSTWVRAGAPENRITISPFRLG